MAGLMDWILAYKIPRMSRNISDTCVAHTLSVAIGGLTVFLVIAVSGCTRKAAIEPAQAVVDAPLLTPPPTVVVTATPPSPDRFGLTFGRANVQNDPNNLIYSACAGDVRDMQNARNGQCNPVQGDTSCRTALSVLCVEKTAVVESTVEGGASDWVGGRLAMTQPVAGFVLQSYEHASALCAKELGEGWRMAEIHDAPNSEPSHIGLLGLKGAARMNFPHGRHWVANKSEKANCWDLE